MLRLLTLSVLLALPARADAPRVVTDIPPVHGIVSAVMDGLGTPHMLLRPGGSPHDLSLRPSDAQALQDAALVVWVGHSLSPQLERPLENLGDARSLELMVLPGTKILAAREEAVFEGAVEHDHEDEEHHADHDDHHDDDDHDHGDEDGHEEDHADHGDKDDHDENEHDHAEDHGDDHDDHDDHAGHAHDHGGSDPHAWLDPENAKHWAKQIAKALGEIDPDNMQTYLENAQTLIAAIDHSVAGFPDFGTVKKPILLLHDSTFYFETAVGLKTLGAVSDSHDQTPGPARLRALQAAAGDGACLMAEPDADTRISRSIGADVTVVEVDPLGLTVEAGPMFYPELLTRMANAFASCP